MGKVAAQKGRCLGVAEIAEWRGVIFTFFLCYKKETQKNQFRENMFKDY